MAVPNAMAKVAATPAEESLRYREDESRIAPCGGLMPTEHHHYLPPRTNGKLPRIDDVVAPPPRARDGGRYGHGHDDDGSGRRDDP